MKVPERIYLVFDGRFTRYCICDGEADIQYLEKIGYVREDTVRNIIETEPEYVDEIPQELQETMLTALSMDNLDFLVHTLRATVKLTKKNILTRLANKLAEKE